MEAKIQKITIAPSKDSVGYILKRIKRDRRCCLTCQEFVSLGTNHSSRMESCKQQFTHGCVVVICNEQYTQLPSEILQLLGSNESVSAIWYIDNYDTYLTYKDNTLRSLTPVAKHSRSNSGNKCWSGHYIVYCKGGKQVPIEIPSRRTDRQIGNLYKDFCPTGELAEIKKRLVAELKSPLCCYICGETLCLGDAQICHLLPRDMGGFFRNNNLAWGHKDCNRMQGNNTIQNCLKKFETILKYQCTKNDFKKMSSST